VYKKKQYLFCFEQFISFIYARVCLKSWWVIAFFLLAFCFYERGVKVLEKELSLCCDKEKALLQKIAFQDLKRLDLECQIKSQNDPEWIELELIRVLGVVPDGYTKIYFQETEKDFDRVK